jgi:hypothetical protein
MKETRIRLSEKDHERLRIAAAFGKKSMAEFVKYATLQLIDAFEAEYEQRLAAHRAKDTDQVTISSASHDTPST